MTFPWFLSMSVGFLSLSQEILWMRYMGFAAQGMPQMFSLVLGIFLAGIAFGAYAGRIICARIGRLYTVSALVLVVASVLDMFGPLVAAPENMRFLVPVFIFLCAMLKSIIFPIAHHLGSSQAGGQMGRSISRVYFMNIVGSALGPVVTGFWLLDHLTTQQVMAIMALLTGLLAVAVAARENRRAYVAGIAAVPLALGWIGFVQPLYVTKSLTCYLDRGDVRINHTIETKSGIVQTLIDGGLEKGGDVTLGGNIYDGRINIDPAVNSNGLERVAVLATLKSRPERVLVVGMSSGAWTRVLGAFPGVKSIDVIEINPGYIDLIEKYPEVSPILKDPRVRLHIDDGRRWLKRNREEMFDLIVMNTTYSWRAYSTYLLSREFLHIIKGHLNPGGIVTYNTTFAPDALKTAESVFPFAFRYVNFVIAGDEDFRPRLKKDGEKQLLSLRLDGKPYLDTRKKGDREFIKKVLTTPFTTSKDQVKESGREGDIITDWNMITEYRHGSVEFGKCKI